MRPLPLHRSEASPRHWIARLVLPSVGIVYPTLATTAWVSRSSPAGRSYHAAGSRVAPRGRRAVQPPTLSREPATVVAEQGVISNFPRQITLRVSQTGHRNAKEEESPMGFRTAAHKVQAKRAGTAATSEGGRSSRGDSSAT